MLISTVLSVFAPECGASVSRKCLLSWIPVQMKLFVRTPLLGPTGEESYRNITTSTTGMFTNDGRDERHDHAWYVHGSHIISSNVALRS